MSGDPLPPRSDTAPAPLGGWPGAATVLIKFINGLTNERLLLMTTICLLAYMSFFSLSKQAERETYQARLYEESRAENQRHCDTREEKVRADLTMFFSQQAEAQRKHDSDQTDLQRRHDAAREDRLTGAYRAETDKLKLAISMLVQAVAEIERAIKK